MQPPPEPPDDSSAHFAPDDYTDNRFKLDWRTKYEGAWRYIGLEVLYLLVLLIVGSCMVFDLITSAQPAPSPPTAGAGASFVPSMADVIGIAWLSGLLGGTMFSIKWLYHSVAKQIWNLDRRLWRLFTPLVSATLGVAFVLLISSGLFGVFNPDMVEVPVAVAVIGFLVGYFSDTALAKLAEIAETLFGETKRIGKRSGRSSQGQERR
jgi:hypothetical protein